MFTSRFGQLFLTLSSAEKRSFRKFLGSSFFNHQPILSLLWDELISLHEDLDVLPEKKILFDRLNPGTPYNDQQLRLWISRIYQHLLHFLAYQEASADEAQFKLYEARALHKKQLDQHFQRSLGQAEKKIAEDGFRNAEYWQFSFQLQLEQSRQISKIQYSGEQALQQLSDTLDLAYLTAKLRHICLLLTHEKVFQSHFKIGLQKDILAYIKEAKLLQEPAIACYFHYYHTLVEPKENTHFQAFKSSIFAHSHQFPPDEIRDLFLLAINYCVKKGNEGQKSYISEMLDLYKAGLKADILLEQGELSHFTYHNIATAGLKTKAYQWVDHFIHTYRNKLARKHRESSYSFNLARLAYAQAQYDKALPLLQKANYQDLLLNLAAKTLLLKIYYELDEFDLLHAHLDAMKNFIRRKAVIGYHRSNYLNIISFTKKLTSINPYDKNQRKELKTQIEETENLTEKEWLLEQV
ncbi:MAG: hypothetical protein R2828_03650 [Saprospiraceae bacterium]